MKTNSTRSAAAAATALVTEAWEAVGASFGRFCLTTGMATLVGMMEEDATRLCGRRYRRSGSTALDDLRAKRSQIIRHDLVQQAIFADRDQLPFENGSAHRTGAAGHRRRGKSPFPKFAEAVRRFDPPVCTLLLVGGELPSIEERRASSVITGREPGITLRGHIGRK
jgi:hypothetical protein